MTKHNQKGVVLFIAILLFLLLSIGAVVILLTASNYATFAGGQVRRIQALALAEAGIHYAYYQLSPWGSDPAQFALDHADPGDDIQIDGTDVTIIVRPDTPSAGIYKIESQVAYRRVLE